MPIFSCFSCSTASASCVVTAVSLSFAFWNAKNPATRAIVINGIVGIPGTIPITASKPDTTPRTRGSLNISFLISTESDSSLPEALDTIKPVAVEISKAGICETRPSPTVNIV